MTPWRPSSTIRLKALGLYWRDGCLLASEVNRDDGTLKRVRPLGGTVEFGESWQDALIREFQDEIGVGIELIGDPIVLENIYTHHGALGHEILFVSEIIFSPNAYETDEFIEYFEGSAIPASRVGSIFCLYLSRAANFFLLVCNLRSCHDFRARS